MPKVPYRTAIFPERPDGGESILNTICPLAGHFIRRWHDDVCQRHSELAAHYLMGSVIERLPGSRLPGGEENPAREDLLNQQRAVLITSWLTEEAAPAFRELTEANAPGTHYQAVREAGHLHRAGQAVPALADLAGLMAARQALWSTNAAPAYGENSPVTQAVRDLDHAATNCYARACAELERELNGRDPNSRDPQDEARRIIEQHHATYQLKNTARQVADSAARMLHRLLDEKLPD